MSGASHGSQPADFANEPVWRSATVETDHCLVEILARLAKVGR